jgi:hypothetical protein
VGVPVPHHPVPERTSSLAPRLRVGAVHDPLEREADAVADEVMRMPDPGPALLQRCPGGCPGEEELRRQGVAEPDVEEEDEEVVQGKGRAGGVLDARVADPIARRRGSGRPLPAPERAFFEPRLGTTLSAVRVHADGEAASLADRVRARAFTVGSDVYFGTGEWRPGSTSSRWLLAHELAHVAQQRDGRAVVRRRVQSVTCTGGTDNAPADPTTAITGHDADAQRFAAAAQILFSIAEVDPTLLPSAHTAYIRRFGPAPTAPPARGSTATRFRDRRRGRIHATREEAEAVELRAIAARFARLDAGLRRSVRYVCRSTAHTVGGCRFGACPANRFASACTGNRRVQICPHFWDITDQQRAGVLVHEMGHIALGLGHRNGNFAQRFANAECYTSMVADIYGFTPADPACPPV